MIDKNYEGDKQVDNKGKRLVSRFWQCDKKGDIHPNTVYTTLRLYIYQIIICCEYTQRCKQF